MKHIKTFNEHDTIPDNFIRLDSIGHVLDPDEGIIYAMWKRGGYDHENGYDVDEVEVQGLDERDKDLLDRHWLSVEPLVKDKINFDLIDTAKDLSLDYLDQGMRLIIYVFIDDILVYTQIFNHDSGKVEYPKYFKHKLDSISESLNVVYRIRLDDKNYHYSSVKSKELSNLLQDYFPNEKIELIYMNYLRRFNESIQDVIADCQTNDVHYMLDF